MTFRPISDNELTNLQAKDEWGKFDFIYSEFPIPALHSRIRLELPCLALIQLPKIYGEELT